MISLGILIALWAVSLLLAAFAMARVARALGSDRGQYRVGVVAALLVFLISVAVSVIGLFIRTRTAGAELAIVVGLVALQWIAVFAMLRRVFRLSPRRTLGPLAAQVAVSLLMLGLALLVVRPYLVEAFSMPTQSMSPALEPGDAFLVNKPATPRRWAVVAYWNVDDRRPSGPPMVFAKRLIGLPGERLRFEDRTLYVNDEPVMAPHPFTGGYLNVPRPGLRSLYQYVEGETIELGADEYFLVGDALDISADSRHYGPTRAHDLIGVVESRYWPPGRIGVVR